MGNNYSNPCITTSKHYMYVHAAVLLNKCSFVSIAPLILAFLKSS